MYGELCSYEPDSNDAVDSVVCKMKLASPAGFFAVSPSERLRLETVPARNGLVTSTRTIGTCGDSPRCGDRMSVRSQSSRRPAGKARRS
jgi:hypothetical protein